MDNPVGPSGGTTAASMKDQSFLGTDFVAAGLDFTIISGGLPVASSCLPVVLAAV